MTVDGCRHPWHCQVINSLRPSDAYMRQETNHHWFRKWLVAWPAPSHYLNQCWIIVNSTLRNKLQWNFNRNQYIFIEGNALENVVCKMASISSRRQWVNYSVVGTGILDNQFHAVAAEAPASGFARGSASMALNIQDKQITFFYQEGLHCLVSYPFWETIENADTFLCVTKCIFKKKTTVSCLKHRSWKNMTTQGAWHFIKT